MLIPAIELRTVNPFMIEREVFNSDMYLLHYAKSDLPLKGTTSITGSGNVTKANEIGSSLTVLSKMILFIERQKSMLTSFSKTCM